MSNVALSVQDLAKRYRIGAAPVKYRTLRNAVVGAVGAPLARLRSVLRGGTTILSDDEVWALDGVSFEVGRGEVVGVVGRNGAGKTTLLKLLSRITEPTRGRAEIHGRVASLLEVGTGFHPELTGRENIFLNGAILGMRRAEITAKFDEIVAFAEVDRFIDTQVKHYSSGMYLRLAFAVAAHLEPEILLVDEVLAVGDASFQRKCLGKMRDVSQSGRTVLFVSHNMEAVQRLCERTIWVDAGRVAADGPTAEVVGDYLRTAETELRSTYRADPADDDGQVRLLAAEVDGGPGVADGQIPRGAPFSIRMRWRAERNLDGAFYFIRVWDAQGRFLFGLNHEAPRDAASEHEIVCSLEQNVLAAGLYRVSIGCFRPPSTTLHQVDDCVGLAVLETLATAEGEGFSSNSLFVPRARWRVGETATLQETGR